MSCAVVPPPTDPPPFLSHQYKALAALKAALRSVADIHMASWEVIGKGGDSGNEWSSASTPAALPDSDSYVVLPGGAAGGASRVSAAAAKCDQANEVFMKAIRDVEDSLTLAQHELFAGRLHVHTIKMVP